jgi:protein-disulfide isomerase
MGISAKWAAAFAVAVAFAIGACADPQQISEIKAKVDEIQAQQKDIVAKLEGISQGQKQILAKAPAAAAKQPQEDPNKVYNVPAGKSFGKGPANAPVTIVEFSDFQ